MTPTDTKPKGCRECSHAAEGPGWAVCTLLNEAITLHRFQVHKDCPLPESPCTHVAGYDHFYGQLVLENIPQDGEYQPFVFCPMCGEKLEAER